MSRRQFVVTAGALTLATRAFGGAVRPELHLTTPLPAPEWALLQRELLRLHTEACEIFHAKYFDARHHLRCFPRWGANDGPDDAIEHVNDWPLVHALGGSDRVLELYRAVYEGHVEQYSLLKTREVPLGRSGMYLREFPPQLDWQHISEGLSVFNLMGLSTPEDTRLIERARRFAGFYDGSDPAAPNYDRRHRVIRSMFNGSAGPLLRPTTAMDWAGDPFDTSKFELVHGERNFEEFLAHFAEYTDTVCDSPLNLQSTTLALNAYLLTGESRWRDWLLEYVDAWAARAARNGDILPSKVGLDGRIGGKTGKWYEGVYGWGFSPVVPQTGKREDRNRVPAKTRGRGPSTGAASMCVSRPGAARDWNSGCGATPRSRRWPFPGVRPALRAAAKARAGVLSNRGGSVGLKARARRLVSRSEETWTWRHGWKSASPGRSSISSI